MLLALVHALDLPIASRSVQANFICNCSQLFFFFFFFFNFAPFGRSFHVWDPLGSKSINWADFKDAVRCLGQPFTDAQFELVRKAAGEKIDLATFKKL